MFYEESILLTACNKFCDHCKEEKDETKTVYFWATDGKKNFVGFSGNQLEKYNMTDACICEDCYRFLGTPINGTIGQVARKGDREILLAEMLKAQLLSSTAIILFIKSERLKGKSTKEIIQFLKDFKETFL